MFTLAQVLALDPAFVEAEARREVRVDRGDPDEPWRSTLNLLDGREPMFVPRWVDYRASAVDRLKPHLAELRRLHWCYGLASPGHVPGSRRKLILPGAVASAPLLSRMGASGSCSRADASVARN